MMKLTDGRVFVIVGDSATEVGIVRGALLRVVGDRFAREVELVTAPPPGATVEISFESPMLVDIVRQLDDNKTIRPHYVGQPRRTKGDRHRDKAGRWR